MLIRSTLVSMSFGRYILRSYSIIRASHPRSFEKLGSRCLYGSMPRIACGEIRRIQVPAILLIEDRHGIEDVALVGNVDAAQIVRAANAVRQRARELLNAGAHRLRQAAQRSLIPWLHLPPRIAAEQLVAAVARQRHGDVLARQLRHVVGRDRGGVGERLVEVRDQLRDDEPRLERREDQLRVIGAAGGRPRLGVRGLVVRLARRSRSRTS